ncbi:MAG: class I SAM-dependent methyltransferase [Nitrospirae bacterium]|nr:class I SAM-dependent methyltransferase [Nitrospirota bacterium]
MPSVDLTKMTYRDRLYANYGHEFQDAGEQFDREGAVRWGRATVYQLRGWIPPKKESRILDLACGAGRLLFFFSERGYKNLTGVDISPDQVALASQVTPDVRHESVLDHLESHPDSYDLITGYDIIEHFHKDEALRFLDGCHGALRPGGRLILQTPNADSPWGTMHRYNDFTHEICFSPNSLSRLMRLVGFSHIEPREVSPVPFGNSIASSVRYLIWQLIRAGLGIWNLAETGTTGAGVWTRVFLMSGVKQ